MKQKKGFFYSASRMKVCSYGVFQDSSAWLSDDELIPMHTPVDQVLTHRHISIDNQKTNYDI